MLLVRVCSVWAGAPGGLGGLSPRRAGGLRDTPTATAAGKAARRAQRPVLPVAEATASGRSRRLPAFAEWAIVAPREERHKGGPH